MKIVRAASNDIKRVVKTFKLVRTGARGSSTGGGGGDQTGDEIIAALAAAYPDFVVTLGSDAAGDPPSQAIIDSLVALGVKEKNVLYADTGPDLGDNTFTIAPINGASNMDSITLVLAGGSFTIAPLDSASTIDNIVLTEEGVNLFTIAAMDGESIIDNITLSGGGGIFTIAAMDSGSTIDEVTIFEPASANIWNSADIGSNLTLSNGDRTVTHAGTSWNTVRSVGSSSDGNRYEELTSLTGGSLGATGLGIGTSSVDLNAFLGFSATGWAVATETGGIWNNTVEHATNIGQFAANDILCIAWESSTGSLWLKKNGAIDVGVDTPFYTGISGTLFVIGGSNKNTGAVEIAGEAANWAFSVPAGYIGFGA